MDWGWLNTFTYLGIAYAILYTGSKIIFSIMSLLEIRVYFWRYDHIIEEHELTAHLKKNKHEMPLISIISPAYNEGILIIDTVSSFLHQSYKNKEVIVCSDGGTDGTLEKLIEHFDLIEVEDTFIRSPAITHKTIRRFLKSTNPRYHDLIVIDKENGGKADAQNAGVAIARGEIVTIIDADSILEKYALIHLADVFERERRIVGVGTPIGVVNDCNIGPDGVDDASVPKSFWAKIQVIEYMRSFLLGRMFAQRYRGLQIVSGAFGVYKKWIIEAVGGYTTGSLAEDMDIDGKIWRYIDSNKLNYRIRYIPEAFCWSEVPDTLKSLASQRDRWARGMTETIWKNKDLFFNPKYKMLGLFSYPYYVFFEWLTPFIEVIGILYFIIGASLGWFSFQILEYIFLAYWIVGIILNISALSVEAFTRGHYKNRATLLKLSFYAILEPLFFHWINSYLYVMGNLKLLLFRKKGWGNMERVGLKKSQEPDEEKTDEKIEAKDIGNEPGGNGAGIKRKVLVGMLIVAIIGVPLYWFYFNYSPNIETKANIQAKIGTEEQQTLSITELDEKSGISEIVENQLSDSIQIPTSEAETVQADDDDAKEIASNLLPIVITPGTIDTVLNQTGHYYIIIASVLNPEFVIANAQKLSRKGVCTKIIPAYGKRGFNLLAVFESDSREETLEKFEVLKPQYGEDIWVLVY